MQDLSEDLLFWMDYRSRYVLDILEVSEVSNTEEKQMGVDTMIKKILKAITVGTLIGLGIVLPTPEILGHTPRIPWMLYEHNVWLCYIRWIVGISCFLIGISVILRYVIKVWMDRR